MNEKGLIVVEQLPIIKEKLETVSKELQKEVDSALALAPTQENKQSIKKARANLTSIFEDLETQRKKVKGEIEKPYKEFIKVYENTIKNVYDPAKEQLDKKINDLENIEKQEKEEKVKKYYLEYCKSKGIDFVEFERVGLNITLTASEKSLKEQCKLFVDSVIEDLELISTQEYQEEIMVEYKKTLLCSASITSVIKRHEEIEKIKAEKEAAEEKRKSYRNSATKVVQASEILSAPKEQEKEISITFTVTSTKENIISVREFMKERGIKYE